MSRSLVAPHVRRAAGATAALLALASPPAMAQRGGNGFLFARPEGSLSVRIGMSNPRARSDLFDYTTDTLTLNRSDFAALHYALELALVPPHFPQVDFVLGAGYARSSAPSEFRNWVDADDRPIEQTTRLQQVPLMASLKLYVAPRGRDVGHFAWMPSRLAPYVGAGAGATWYQFEQRGDFIEFSTLDVFRASYFTRGWGPAAQGLAGVDVNVGTRTALTVDARYLYSRARVSGQFEGFDRLDLSGLTTSLGLTYRF